MPSKMPTEGTETLDWWAVRAEATLANNISGEDPPGPTEINHQVTQVSKK